jgi:release factor glutamine methyltransferase
MKLVKFREDFINSLNGLYDQSEAQELFNIALEDVFRIKPIELAINRERSLSDENFIRFSEIQKRLLKKEPIQHIIGFTFFRNLKFTVNPNVLIPRPETEELVQWLVSDFDFSKEEPIKILDLCTGSGCIAISLASELGTKVRVSALDYSKEALEVARTNATSNKVEIDFLEGDLLKYKELEHFDIMISNPPYVRDSEKNYMKENVLAFEPEMALFVTDKDPLIFYSKIAELFKKQALSSSRLYLEINQYLEKETIADLKAIGLSHIEMREDFRGNPRMIRAQI